MIRWVPAILAVSIVTVHGPASASQGASQSAQAAAVPPGDQWLGTVRIPQRVRVDDGWLETGSYGVRLTGDVWAAAPPGASTELLRWVEFLQNGSVKGRTIASIVPANTVPIVVKGTPPPPGQFRVQRLARDDDAFVRAWYNFGGDQLLIHFTYSPRPETRGPADARTSF